jgi:hypothetical protein
MGAVERGEDLGLLVGGYPGAAVGDLEVDGAAAGEVGADVDVNPCATSSLATRTWSNIAFPRPLSVASKPARPAGTAATGRANAVSHRWAARSSRASRSRIAGSVCAATAVRIARGYASIPVR